MKVFFTLIPAFNPNEGGVQRTTWKLGKYFTEQGIDVVYYSLAHDGHIDSIYGKLYYAPKPGSSDNTENIKDLQDKLEQVKPDIVINQMPYYKPLRECLYDNKRKVGYLLLGCLRNSLFNFKNNARDRMREMFPKLLLKVMDNALGEAIVQKRHWLTHRRDLKAILDQHDYFVLLAPPNQEELAYFVGDYKKEKVVSIPNSIPQVEPKLPPKEKTILHVGRINIQQKRSDLLLLFWQHTYKQLPDWNFVIVGDGPYLQQLRTDLNTRTLPRVSLEGFQKPEAYYKSAAIFMMPSAYEGFPNTLLEAQSYGCASLAFNSYAALDWIVQEGENALLIPPFDMECMAKKTIEVAQNPKTLEALQRASLQNASKFTIDRVGKMWLNFFEHNGIH